MREWQIVFAFSSPYGILPLAMNLGWPERSIVHSARQTGILYTVTRRDNFGFEVNHDG